MNAISTDGLLAIPLYHGTSTLFIDSIFQHGLGGKNPILDWKVHDLAKEVLTLCEEHLMDCEMFSVRHCTFRNMVEQKITEGGFNFQHGDTYLSPARKTAIKYASDNKLGSELVTYTIDFLRELMRRKILDVKDDLYRRFPQAFNLMNISAAPILIEVRNVPIAALLTEEGGDPATKFEWVIENIKNAPDHAEDFNQQTNFRLTQPIGTNILRFWLINVTRYKDAWCTPEYSLYEITKAK